MNGKNIIVSILLIAGSMHLLSCGKNFLDVAKKDEIPGEDFFKTAGDADQAVVGIYNTLIQNGDYTIIQKVLAHNTWSDDAVNVWQGSDYNTIAAGAFTVANGFIENNWIQLYFCIRRTNVFLTNIGQVQMDEALKKRYIAEVRFFRAYYYHQLLILFGGVPIIEKPLNIGELKVPRNKRSEVVDFILADLNAAVPDLPVAPSQPGRVTSGTALAFKSRVLLYEYRFEEAAAAAKQVMDQGQYGLYTADGPQSYINVFARQHENNKEVLFDIQFTDQDGYGSSEQLWLNIPSLNGWGALDPLQSLVDAFEDSLGNPITASPVYNAAQPYKGRDPRLEMSIIHNGSSVTDHNGVSHVINTLSGTDGYSRSGYYPRKNADPASFVPGVTGSRNYILIRYAEVLLNYAEAQNEATGPDATVYTAINSIRQRAGMPGIPAGLTKAQLRDRIRQERRVELCLEGQRTFDIKRWGIGDKVMTGGIYGALNANPIEVRTFDPNKNYLLPIPQNQVDLMGRDILLQNPGYGTPVFADDKYPKPEMFR
jgi:hypothetical protein